MRHPLASPAGLAGRVLGRGVLGPDRAYVDVRDDEVELRFGRLFRGTVPRAAVVAARAVDPPVGAGGGSARMQAGDRLVLGTANHGFVALTLDPPQRLRVALVPRRVREVLVSVEDPAALVSDLRA